MRKLFLTVLVCIPFVLYGQQDTITLDTITVRPNHAQLLKNYVEQIETTQQQIAFLRERLENLQSETQHLQDKIFLISSMYSTEPPRSVTKDGHLIVNGTSN